MILGILGSARLSTRKKKKKEQVAVFDRLQPQKHKTWSKSEKSSILVHDGDEFGASIHIAKKKSETRHRPMYSKKRQQSKKKQPLS